MKKFVSHRFFTMVLLIALALAPTAQQTEAQNGNLAKQLSKAFRNAIEKVEPAVVSIQAERRGNTRPQIPSDVPEWFRQFMPPNMQPPQMPERRQEWQGTGVIIGPEGEILTNNHVIAYQTGQENRIADKINVTLSNGDFYEASVIATDPQTDIALIKIDSDKPLPYSTMGDSDQLELGDWVLAIGNPFGLSHSISQGIVSAMGRTGTDVPVGTAMFSIKDYIQTTAAINPGNSGGPLINLDGEIVGVNNAIQTAGAVAGNIGIGFAIPSNLAKRVVKDLKEFGKVNRGFLGVEMEVRDDWRDYYREEYGINYGAKISDFTNNSPAKEAGLQQGDVILRVDGVKVRENGHLINLVTQRLAGEELELLIFRNGEEIKKTVTLKERPETLVAAQGDVERYLGMELQTLTSEMAKEKGFDETMSGVVVSRVNPAGPAAEKDIQEGDVITEMNDKSVQSVGDVEEILTSIIDEMRSENDNDRPILFKVHRTGSGSHKFVAPYITLEVQEE